ncbi:hypothetical protein BS50DRAFT_587025 [Corynespora cassiicola Philippines]|uniref:Uncharacterized protein n=1 Tax=Corynespora cassiicola Philippines TaxID=1448308 RepID=A0A2T2NQV5_CORCC|nr:hypothetical protein BS50DRAFT_587025 [Corynespora cassiicola Philippines]
MASGLKYLPTVIADAVTCIAGSAGIMQIGIWNPFLLASKALISFSGGLWSIIHPGIASGNCIAYQILGGIGFGLINNVRPMILQTHIGMQAYVSKELVPVGASSFMSMASVSEKLIISPELTRRILNSGATNFGLLISLQDLSIVIDELNRSISCIVYLPAAAATIGFFLTLGLEWISLKDDTGSVKFEEAVAGLDNKEKA